MKREFISSSPSQTKKFAKAFLKELSSFRGSLAPLVIALSGELGSGKTTFLQGFAKDLGIREKILSPTFIIYRKFRIHRANFKNFYHIDCYRIKKPRELLDLNFKELSSNPQNIVAIEWADKIKKILPKNTLWLKFELINEKTRKIAIK